MPPVNWNEGIRDNTFRREIHDGVNIVLANGSCHAGRVADVAAHEDIAARKAIRHVDEIVEIPRVRQLIVHDDPIIGVMLEGEAHIIGADEPRSTGDEQVLHRALVLEFDSRPSFIWGLSSTDVDFHVDKWRDGVDKCAWLWIILPCAGKAGKIDRWALPIRIEA